MHTNKESLVFTTNILSNPITDVNPSSELIKEFLEFNANTFPLITLLFSSFLHSSYNDEYDPISFQLEL